MLINRKIRKVKYELPRGDIFILFFTNLHCFYYMCSSKRTWHGKFFYSILLLHANTFQVVQTGCVHCLYAC